MRKPLRNVVWVLAGLSLLIGAKAEDTLMTKVDAVFADWDKPDTAGCVLAVIRDGRIVYSNGYGMANLDHNVPITPQTVFDIGSTSKQFTAASIALLVKEGKLTLDDDIRKHIPEMPRYDRPITIRHLLHHTSGIRDYLVLMALAGMEDHDVYTHQGLVDLLARQKNLNFSPGDEHLYSNSGYILLAVIVERLTGMTMGRFAAERIFEPLNMENTFVYEDATMVVPHRATGYSTNKQGEFEVDHYWNFNLAGDGQVYTTVEDLFLWDQNFYEPKVGGKDLIEMLLTRGELVDGETLDYALGLGHGRYRGLETVQHGGAWGGFRAQMIRVPEHRFTVIVLSNLGTMNPTALAHKVIALYLEEHLEPEEEKKPKDTVYVDPAIYDDYLGQYQLEMGLVFHVVKDDGRLWFQIEDEPREELSPVSEIKYFIEAAGVYLSFQRDTDGKVGGIILHQGEEDHPGKRIEIQPLSAEQLKEYEGDYTSEELMVTYHLTQKDGNLVVRVKRNPEMELDLTDKDSFAGARYKGVFERDASGTITGFILDAGRVKNLCFVKKSQS
jgi:CubicO group peptidase (beta-lactamase class C family)